jgi:hypothetical protein
VILLRLTVGYTLHCRKIRRAEQESHAGFRRASQSGLTTCAWMGTSSAGLGSSQMISFSETGGGRAMLLRCLKHRM